MWSDGRADQGDRAGDEDEQRVGLGKAPNPEEPAAGTGAAADAGIESCAHHELKHASEKISAIHRLDAIPAVEVLHGLGEPLRVRLVLPAQGGDLVFQLVEELL